MKKISLIIGSLLICAIAFAHVQGFKNPLNVSFKGVMYFEEAGGGPFIPNALSTNFDGVNDHVVIPDVAAIKPTTSISVFCWAKMAANDAETVIADRLDSGFGVRWSMFVDNQGDPSKLGVIVSGDGGAGGGARQCTYGAGTSFDGTNWYHLGFTWTGSSNQIAYVNGAVAAEQGACVLPNTPDAAMVSNTFDVAIGAIWSGSEGTGANFATGNVDECTIWDKAGGLSAAEVTELYNGGAVFDYSTHSAAANLVLWYRMGDGDTFPTITDQQGNSDGTMTNMDSGDFQADVP